MYMIVKPDIFQFADSVKCTWIMKVKHVDNVNMLDDCMLHMLACEEVQFALGIRGRERGVLKAEWRTNLIK